MLKGRVALITGASRGIGRSVARRLAQAGASVAINYNSSSESAEALEAEIARTGTQTLTVKADVSSDQERQALLETVEERLGPIDILVNNAGFVRDRLLLRMTEDDWSAVWATDYAGSAWLCRAVLPEMRDRGWGRIVNVTSIVGMAGNAGQANYAAAKGALIGLTKDLAGDAARHGVTVNCVSPGYINTDATAALTEQYREAWLEQVPMGRRGEPEEIAGIICFLAGPEASYITGQCIVVDGGLLIARR